MGMNSDGSESSVHEIREISLRGFETWLDSALAGEQPPPGLAADLLTAIIVHGKLCSIPRCRG